ncbi:MAG TPA: pirin family protein [Ramlibacter sp.]|jgi:Pirin-related protein|nr:pirin family protein [Ramlibacter sp.]
MGIAAQLEGQEKDLGSGFLVRRLLPQARLRNVGPFIFFDHFGPSEERPGVNHDVRPHPHIGLATVTYLFDGAMMHRDSLGNAQLIEPGAINWMTAGRGIVHSERKKPEQLGSDSNFSGRSVAGGRLAGKLESDPNFLHGLQLWTALPLADEEVAPSFSHTPADAIPECSVGDGRVRVLVGEAFEARSPVPALGSPLYLDIWLPSGGRIELPPLATEQALYGVEGTLEADGEELPERQLALLKTGEGVELFARAGARLVVVGGDPLDAPRHMWWNFVSSRKERIVQASADWEAMRMGTVPGDDQEFIPLPQARFKPPEPMS